MSFTKQDWSAKPGFLTRSAPHQSTERCLEIDENERARGEPSTTERIARRLVTALAVVSRDQPLRSAGGKRMSCHSGVTS